MIKRKRVDHKKTPVHIVCGFLGSGKTTFIKEILKGDEKVAFIQNEFSSEMGIELNAITGADGKPIEGIWELPSGCLCCTLKDSLAATLDMVLDNEDPDSPYERVIIECNGSADPVEIIHKLWTDDELLCNFYLKNTIAILDAANFSTNYQRYKTIVTKQLACADVGIITKTRFSDQMAYGTTDKIEKVKEVANQLNPTILIQLDTEIDLSRIYKVSMHNLTDTFFTEHEDVMKTPNIEKDDHHRHWVQYRLLKWPQESVVTIDSLYHWIDKWIWSDEYQNVPRGLYEEELVFESSLYFKNDLNEIEVKESKEENNSNNNTQYDHDLNNSESFEVRMNIIRAKGIIKAIKRDSNEMAWHSIQIVGADVEIEEVISSHYSTNTNTTTTTITPPPPSTENKILIIGVNLPSEEIFLKDLLN